MGKKKIIDFESLHEIDRMIDEGLSGGTINPAYTEAHLKLKAKYQNVLLNRSDKLEKTGDE
ncbi:hypothetical protein [Planococcus versutus]|uniref:Uncharacterized protein n=1 Tax=Planococcus versutus TaxID=1302659 RepID=A0A1B1S4S6_9BACL|nr:hypothetical protein [Planococcus versutus]ANU28193.1 hypothetical protein I858_014470 [Planococcus versutus]